MLESLANWETVTHLADSMMEAKEDTECQRQYFLSVAPSRRERKKSHLIDDSLRLGFKEFCEEW